MPGIIEMNAVYVPQPGSIDSSLLADGAVTAEKLADSAVTAAKVAESAITLDSNKVVGQLPGVKLADSAVTESKLANSAVTANKVAESAIVLESNKVVGQLPGTKLADEAVDVSKTTNTVRQVPLIMNVNETYVIGTTETAVKSASFSKNAKTNWIAMVINAALKITNPAAKATLKLYINNEANPRVTLETQSTNYDLKASEEIDISDLTSGTHTVTAKLVSDTEGATAYNKTLELHFVKA